MMYIYSMELFDDIEGNITCTANDGRGFVDYIIASSNLIELFSTFAVDNYDVSDHFPLKCSLRLCLKRNAQQNAVNNDELRKLHKYKWKGSLKDIFLHEYDLHYYDLKSK